MEFQFGDWLVSPEANLVSNGDAKTQLEPRVMAVLRYLCRHPGAVIPAEEILQACWGSSELGDNPVHKAITQLRRAFGDSSTEPRYIETIRKRGYRAIAPVITFAAPPAMTWEGGSPFRGLEAFQENHSAIFFGRVQATAKLRELVLTQAAHGCPMALVLGPSGSGKTSLVRAGLLPQLMAGAIRSDEPIGLVSTVYLDCADLGSGTLFQALAGALIDADIHGEPLFPGASADSLGQRLDSDPNGVMSELRHRAFARAQVGVFVDRLEAVFRAQSDVADRFLATIDALGRSNCLLVMMACRNDFYPEVMAQPILLALKSRGGHFDVLPPDGAEIAQMVRQPSLAANLVFEKDEATGASLDDVICDAARGNPDMLPLLQYTLNELYRLREDTILKFEVYRQLGGIEGAVGVRAEQVVSRMSALQIAALPHVLSLLVNIVEEQAAVTSRRSPLSMLRTEDEKELVRVMVEARLFVSELAGDVPSFGVAHEALLRRWTRVSDWIEQYRVVLQLRSRLEGQAQRWSDANRSRDLLLPRGTQVTQASELLTLEDFALSPLASEFVRASVSRAKLGERVRLAVTTLIGIMAVMTTILAFTARSAQMQAETSRSEAEDLMTYMLGDFVEKLRPIGRLELLDDVSKKAMLYLGKASTEQDGSASFVHRAKALRLIGEVHANRGKPNEAFSAFLLARELLQRNPDNIAVTPAAIRENAVNAFMLGQLHLGRNELDKASNYLNQYLALSKDLATASNNDAESLLEQSYAYNSLGSLSMRQNQFRAAAGQFQLSLQLKQKVQEAKPKDAALEVDIANSYSWLAEAKLKLGELSSARDLYNLEEKRLRPVYQGNGAWTNRLGLSLMRQGILQAVLGETLAAKKYFKDSEELFNQAIKIDPSNRIWQNRLLMAQVRSLELEAYKSDTSELLPRLEHTRAELARINELDPNNSNGRVLAAKVEQLRGVVLFRSGRISEATESLQAALDAFEAYWETRKQDPLATSALAEAYLTQAESTAQLKKGESAQAICAKAAKLLPESTSNSTDYALLALQVRANLCAGNAASVAQQMQALDKMGYREPRYQHYVTSQPKR